MKSQEDLTEYQKKFIGTKFPTPKGGIITVIGVDDNDSNVNVKFIVECSICSKDKELFPDNLLITKSHLIGGSCPCGCPKIPKWDERQYKVIIKRVCDERGYIFKGFAESFRGGKTKLKLYNPTTGNEWCSTDARGIITKRGDPVEGRIKTEAGNIKEIEAHIGDFMKTGSFLQGTTFTRNTKREYNGRFLYWDVTCPICSKDIYVENGLCSGIFTCHRSALKRGNNSCRCSLSYRWDKDQRKFQIENVLKREGSEWVGWVDSLGYKNSWSKFKWICPENHHCETSVVGFLNAGIRCRYCQIQDSCLYGYFKHRLQEKDYLYVYTFKNLPYIKVGRSFDPSRRFQENQKRVNKYYQSDEHEISTVKLYSASHEIIYNLEQYLVNKDTSHLFKGTFDESLHLPVEYGYGSIELLRLEGLEPVITFLDNFTYNEDGFMGYQFRLLEEK